MKSVLLLFLTCVIKAVLFWGVSESVIYGYAIECELPWMHPWIFIVFRITIFSAIAILTYFIDVKWFRKQMIRYIDLLGWFPMWLMLYIWGPNINVLPQVEANAADGLIILGLIVAYPITMYVAHLVAGDQW